jgi:hypothetical protein
MEKKRARRGIQAALPAFAVVRVKGLFVVQKNAKVPVDLLSSARI